MIVKKLIVTVLLASAVTTTGASASSGTYIYTGRDLVCANTPESSCVVKVKDPGHLVASFTFSPDFVQGAGDQTVLAFDKGIHYVTDWSVTDGYTTLSSANGDTLTATSSFTFNIKTIRTWAWDVSGAGGSFSAHAPLYLDSAFDSHGIAYAHGNGSFTPGGGPATGGVPEPAAWALLLTGFGLTGAAMRRRDRSLAA